MKNLNKLGKDELIELVKKLQRRKKYGLVWEEKSEDVVEQCKKELPVLEEDVNRAIEKDSDGPTNLLIEGDNYHALSVLNYTHAGKVDVIYIDPPYNTGARNWKYNNSYVDKEDSFRHSKFISFIYRRVQISKALLKNTGIFICAIDDFEVQNVRHILDEIFGESNRIGSIVVIHNPGGRQDEKFFPTAHEYMLVYAKDISKANIGKLIISEGKKSEFKYEDNMGSYKLREFRRSGANSRRTDRPNLWYPIFVHPKTLDIQVEQKKGYDKILPIDKNGTERVWRWNAKTLMQKKDSYINVKKIDRKYRFYVKERVIDNGGEKAKTFWFKPEYSATNGTAMLKKIFSDRTDKIFDFPKSPYLIKDILKITSLNKDDVILDFFAGSGTTGHSAMILNQEDGGNRKFILCANNELNGKEKELREQGVSEDKIWEHGICRDITYPRIKRVIDGYNDTDGIPANLRYFKTAFVSKSNVSDDTRRELVRRSTEMICVRENTFDKIADNKNFKIYKDINHVAGILFDLDSIEEFKDKIRKIKMSSNIYVFSLTNDTFDEDFDDLGLKHELCPIPESILEVYRKLFK